MKQHITINQFKELSEVGREKLIGWADSHMEIRYSPSGEMWSGHVLLSIGQMIEFLDEKTKWYIRIGHWMDPGETTEMGWVVGDYKIDESFTGKEYWDKTELCDALWEAVKEVLERKDYIAK